MEPIRRGELEDHISFVTVIFSDTGETVALATRKDSTCHFFERFAVGNDDIQLRLDWADLDCNDQPTLDADFINNNTGNHRTLKGKRKHAHHTASSPGEGRCYEWSFDSIDRQFSVAVTWCTAVTEELRIGAFCTAEIISATDRKLRHG